ncbi:MAG: ABC transporter permease [Saprospiraceae bacterium]|nr:ABC transporter permease [Saprospiraceae bacterium]
MLKHIFLMIWNQKGRNFGLMLEIFFSFLVLFAVLSFIIYNYNFFRQPLGFSYEKVWMLSIATNDSEKEEIIATREAISRQLAEYPQIESFSFSTSNMPYWHSSSSTSMSHNGIDLSPDVFTVDENFKETMSLNLVAGRWLTKEDQIPESVPIVINSVLKDRFFENENPLQQKIVDPEDNSSYQIVGVVDHFKFRGEFSPSEAGFFRILADTVEYADVVMLKVNEGADATFEAKLQKDLNNIAGNWSFNMVYLDEQRDNRLSQTQTPMIVLLTICGFLIFNVALGLFGMLWNNINKRKGEIGIRKAMGSTQVGLSKQFMGEVAVLSTFSIAFGAFFAVQFPLLKVFHGSPFFMQDWIYLAAIILSALLIYFLVLLCSFFPSRQAARLHPAIALHEE